tara:strand:- start:1155 stop:3503 length:2349 start_codon:yes stop_codon:yes gene_type:complete
MVSNQKLFSVGNFDFRLQHLLIIGILAISVSISMSIRAAPMAYGLELFEFDPFYNFRATEYVVNNGSQAYFEWFDEKSWYPFGRNVSESSQVILHLTTAISYQIFGFGMSLYDFTVLFPLVIGSLTSILVFAFVRVIGGTTAGLFAALIFSISLPIITRGLVGWFKSEPLGLFFGFLAIYLFVSGLKFDKGKISAIKLISAGLFFALGLSAWGGILFFILGVLAFYFIIPFFKHETNFSIWAIPVFSISLIIFSSLLERTSELITYVSFAIVLATIFVVVSELIKKFSSDSSKIRNCIIFLVSIIASGLAILYLGLNTLPSFRYLNAVNPFLTTKDPLTDSVAEHMTTDITMSFALLSILMVFSLIGIWSLFSKKSIGIKNDMRVFALVFSLLAIYVSSAFVRLELFASVAAIILGSIGLAILLRSILKLDKNLLTKSIFGGIIVLLFTTPLVYPEQNWTTWGDIPPTILTGGVTLTPTNDWLDAGNWLKENTSQDAVIAAWWDYGYWITTLSERTTLIDNATLLDWQIKKMGYVLMTNPTTSWNILNSHYSTDISEYLGEDRVSAFGGSTTEMHLTNYQAQKMGFGSHYNRLSDEEKKIVDNNIEKNGFPTCKQIFKAEAARLGIPEQSCNPVTKGMDADYVLIYVNGNRFFLDEAKTQDLYVIEGGGDESKKHWFAQISNHQVSKFVQSDGMTPTPYFMEHTALGNLIPFSIVAYVEPNSGVVFNEYKPGRTAIYQKDIKMIDPENDPFYLVYASPGFYSNTEGTMSTVLIYKINDNYQS